MTRNFATAWKMSKYGVFSSSYFPVFGLDTGKYEPEKAPYLDTFHTVSGIIGNQSYHSWTLFTQWLNILRIAFIFTEAVDVPAKKM